MIGTVVADKYRILRRLGAGGMGTVYEAVHVATNRSVAVKVLSRDLSDEPSHMDLSDSMRARQEEVLERFRREALTAGRIRSEHVVQILDAGQDVARDAPFLVMEMLEGDNLQVACKRLRQISPVCATKIAVQACRGLVDAHATGVVHRDVKSANLLLARRSDGEIVVKLLDFGIAKVRMEVFQAGHESGLTNTGTMLGSPHYMSPEQAKGLKTIDHRADVWSLGVVLYRMLTGANPFDAPSLGQILLSICTEEPLPLSVRAPWVSPAIAAIVERALRKSPDERFSTAKEMLDALEAQLPFGSSLREKDLVGLSDAERAMIPDPKSLASLGKSPLTLDSASRPSLENRRAVEADTGMGFRRDTEPAKATKSGGKGWMFGVVAAVAFGVAMGGYAFTHTGGLGLAPAVVAVTAPASAPEPSSPPTAPPATAPSAAPSVVVTASASAALPERVVQLVVEGKDVVALVDAKRVAIEDGKIPIAGVPGSVVKVTLSRRGRVVVFDVVISEQGPVPESVGFDAPPKPAARPTPGPVAATPTGAPPVTTTVKPPPKGPGVGATNTFD